ncbi:MAG: hypothetical protein ACOC5T_00990 [Elusimicrobiota bacterium]
MKITRLFIITLLLLICSGCSLISVRRPDTYVDKIPTLPKEERMSVEGMEALSVGATEINKGLGELKALITYADKFKPEAFAKEIKKFMTRIVTMWDFSYKVMGFLGVSSRDIDWDNPEKYFEQIEAEKEALNSALSEYKEKEQQWKKNMDEFQQKLAEHEKLVKSKREELENTKKEWRIKRNFSIGGLLGLFVLFNLILFVIQVFTKVPVFNMFWGGLIKVFKGTKQLVAGVQDVREHFKRESPDKTYTAKEVKELIDGKLDKYTDENVKKLVKDIKKKYKIKENIDSK